MRNKRGGSLNKMIINIALIGIIFAFFFIAVAGRVNGRDVKQQVLEKQLSLMIDSAVPGMSFEIRKNNINGFVSSVAVSGGRIFINVDGFVSQRGYPYFSKYSVTVKELSGKFVVSING